MYTLFQPHINQFICQSSIIIKMLCLIKIEVQFQKHYDYYDGFVVLHGTDTMAYTASALSFMCEHLGKTIILTGSQVNSCGAKIILFFVFRFFFPFFFY